MNDILRKPRMGATHVHLTLDVQPPQGQPYQATTVWQVDQVALSQAQPGQTIAVKIDAANPQVIYPDMRWAR